MTGYQAKRFLEDLGDKWLKRNRNDLNKNDYVDELIANIKQPFGSVLEIGCSNGWRLKKLKDKYNCQIMGIEPSRQAVKECHENDISAIQGTANEIPFESDRFDLIIMGFCLSVIDPVDYFDVVSESSRVLKDGGTLIIWDYIMPRPFKSVINNLEEPDIFYHFYDWPKLWLAHPGYQTKTEIYDYQLGRVAAALTKNFATAFPIAKKQ